MDLISQALLGAAVGALGFEERLGRRALVVGALVGTFPDLDVFAVFAGDWAALVHHRGLSHSLVVLSLVAPPLGWMLARGFAGEGEDTRAWIALVFWALITHPLLDLFTSFGTQLLAPLSDARFALDGVGALDPLVSVPLALAVMAGGARRRERARATLIWMVCYLGAGAGLSRVAEHQVEAELRARGFESRATRALVAPLLPLTRRVVARDGRGTLEIAVWSPFVGTSRRIARARAPDPRIDQALASPRGQVFAWFADGFVEATLDVRRHGAQVILSDARFGGYRDLGGSPFSLVVDLDAEGQVTRSELGQRPRVAWLAELREAWSLTLSTESDR